MNIFLKSYGKEHVYYETFFFFLKECLLWNLTAVKREVHAKSPRNWASKKVMQYKQITIQQVDWDDI